MNLLAPVVTAAVVSSVVSFAVVQFMGPAEAVESPDVAASAAEREGEIAGLRSEVARLTALMASVEASGAAEKPVARAEVAMSDTRLRTLVDEALQERFGDARAVEASVSSEGDFNVDAAVAALLDGGSVNPNVSQAAWAEIHEAGKTDEVIAAFQRIAEESPDDANAQAQYGEALLAKVMNADGVMEQAKFSQMADQAWSKALALDETHWSARFNKAVSYTFWPAITGKPAEAVTHFETLMSQQEASPSRNHSGHTQTYLMLGNMHLQQGNAEKAREVWERGLQFHPGDEALRSRLGR